MDGRTQPSRRTRRNLRGPTNLHAAPNLALSGRGPKRPPKQPGGAGSTHKAAEVTRSPRRRHATDDKPSRPSPYTTPDVCGRHRQIPIKGRTNGHMQGMVRPVKRQRGHNRGSSQTISNGRNQNSPHQHHATKQGPTDHTEEARATGPTDAATRTTPSRNSSIAVQTNRHTRSNTRDSARAGTGRRRTGQQTKSFPRQQNRWRTVTPKYLHRTPSPLDSKSAQKFESE